MYKKINGCVYLHVYIGASACMELQKYDDAVRWCDDGLAVSLHCEAFLVIRISSDVPSSILRDWTVES